MHQQILHIYCCDFVNNKINEETTCKCLRKQLKNIIVNNVKMKYADQLVTQILKFVLCIIYN
jgi:hypothetical protein